MSDHERIWLQAAVDADQSSGRMWCQDKVWPDDAEDSEPTEYVRADLFAALQSENARLREAMDIAVSRGCDHCSASIAKARAALEAPDVTR